MKGRVIALQKSEQNIIQETRIWIKKVVLGLNLCPFARRVYESEMIRFSISHAQSIIALENDLKAELHIISESNPEKIDNTLLIHPYVLLDFLAYNDFLDTADRLVQKEELEGQIQIASFHPDYRFEDTPPDDAANYTNRSPYPMLHLLRESSVTEAVDGYADIDGLPGRNMETLRNLGIAGIRRLLHSPETPQGET